MSPGNDTILGLLKADKAPSPWIQLPSPPFLVGTKGIACTQLHSTSKSFPLPVGRQEEEKRHTTEIQDCGETAISSFPPRAPGSSPLNANIYKAHEFLVEILCFLQQNNGRIVFVTVV